MEELIDEIFNGVNFETKESFREFLIKCIGISNDSTKSTYAVDDNHIFKIEVFFKNFSTFINAFGKDRKYQAGVDVLSSICRGLAIELEEPELFVFFHLRNMGKYRKREKDLLEELKPLWKQYPEYAMDESDLIHALKELMRKKFITYRRGNLNLCKSVIIRYKTGQR